MINKPKQQPIAIVGMACRFPNAGDLRLFWELLRTGKSGITEGTPGSGKGRIGELFSDPVENKACRFGGYLSDLELFDASFFRISPVEAQFLDPQQRLMLEVCWHALEDACINPETLQGSRTGVYAGISNNEYRALVLNSSGINDPATSLYAVTGTSLNTAIGRVSYALGLGGPALAMDTACSSSLVAVHQAVSGLQQGETDLALAGGVHTIFSGQLLEFRANAGMLSPDGRCATFDAAANGYVRGEGCGIVVLKRFDDALSDGDRIWGVIRGVALNQDGASPGLTVPSRQAQEQVIADALRNAGIAPTDVDYVEAHGTGTEVGDPIEAQAAGTAYSDGRDHSNPVLIGSVKTNIGHLEAAAGVAGIIKVILSMQHGLIPQHLNYKTPSPRIPWAQLPLKVVSSSMGWPHQGMRPKRAGISGFGWSGTNAHLILEEFCPETQEDKLASPLGRAITVEPILPKEIPLCKEQSYLPRTVRLLPLAAKSSTALSAGVANYLEWIETLENDQSNGNGLPSSLLSDMAWSASVGRSHFPHRCGIVFESTAQLCSKLKELSSKCPEVQSYTSPKVAFLFTGQGGQWTHMGEVLYEREPVFRSVLKHLEEVFLEERGVSLLDVMFGRSTQDISATQWAQPAIYALECALVALWESLGVQPDVVIGHSVGEFAAASSAGIFSQEAGMRLITRRSKVLHSLSGSGVMAAIFAPRSMVEESVQAYNMKVQPEELSIAAYNGAHQVISGTPEAVEQTLQQFESNNVRVSRLRTSHAFHSPLVEPALDELENIFDGIEIRPPSQTLISNVTGQLVASDERLNSDYWRRHARQPVNFAQGVQTLSGLGVNIAIEVGPHSVLGPMLLFAWPDASGNNTKPPAPPVTLPSLVRPSNNEGKSDQHVGTDFLHAVARAYESGLPITFEGLYAGESRRRISIPAYQFEREYHWISRRQSRQRGTGSPLLGSRHESASGEIIFESELSPSDPSWLSEHLVYEQIIAPGALYGALAAAVISEENYGQVAIEEMQFYSPMLFALPKNGEERLRKVQVSINKEAEDEPATLRIYSTSDEENTWTLHAECHLSRNTQPYPLSQDISLDSLTDSLSKVDLTDFYSSKAQVGIDLGYSFRTLNELHQDNGEAVAEVSLSPSPLRTVLHPMLLDGCFQVMSAASSEVRKGIDTAYLPFGWKQLILFSSLPEQIVCHASLRDTPDHHSSENGLDTTPEVLTGDLKLYDLNGKMIGEVRGFVARRATRSAMMSATQTRADLLYEVVWRETAAITGEQPADFLVTPTLAADRSEPYAKYLEALGVGYDSRLGLLHDLQKLAYAFALSTLKKLGWERIQNGSWEADALRETLGVLPAHQRLFRRILELLSSAGLLEETDRHFRVLVPTGNPLPAIIPVDKEQFALDMLSQYPHGSVEIQLFQRCAKVLDRVLIGNEDPLEVLFGGEEPTPADLYSKAPVARAVNQVLSDAVSIAIENLPGGRRLRILEVGAGTGSATTAVLPCLSGCSYDYMYTDISAGFFTEAEALFGGEEASMQYRMLDIEKDPLQQGFPAHGYDLIIASNVLHATRYLDDTLKHCRMLLAPSGQLLALENFRPMGWLDLTFGQLDGWWRFADSYRPHHALASPDVWEEALLNAGFVDIAAFGLHPEHEPDRGIIMAQNSATILPSAGMWVLLGDFTGMAEELATELVSNNQQVVLATGENITSPVPQEKTDSVLYTYVESTSREAWSEMFSNLPSDIPLYGIVHLVALNGHGIEAETSDIKDDVQKQVASALALSQALVDEDITVEKGVFFVTSGAQILEKEQGGKPAGAALWGLGKVIAHEADSLQARLIDLETTDSSSLPVLINELLYPEDENHIAYRYGKRHTARLVRTANNTDHLILPQKEPWRIQPNEEGSIDDLAIELFSRSPLDGRQVRVAIETVGLNFWDLFRTIGVVQEGLLGGEMCGKVVEIGSGVSEVSVGDDVVGLAFGTFASEVITHEAMLAPAPRGISKTAAATIPTTFASAELSYQLSGIAPGEKVLVHAGAGGTGMAAVYLAQEAGAEVFATCSPPKQVFLRSIGVEHILNSRTIEFGADILDITNGCGVDVIVNSLTSPGFIEASLSCLIHGGRFVELGRADILTEEEMAELRPDVQYSILMLDVLKESAPEEVGHALKSVIRRFETGKLNPLVHTQWPIASVGKAMLHMRNARHIGKIVLAMPPLQSGRLRADRTYLITGGLGGIGSALAPFLIERGAGTIVLNGRRDPDPDVSEMIRELQGKGHAVHVELADVTDSAAFEDMLMRMERDLPPLGGVIHSVGVLSDASLTNMSWEQCEHVLWPKVLGAWNLHRLTMQYDLDMFVLFSSAAGVIGNRGQANHAAANAFLDQLALMRRTMGLPGQAIAWGAWSGIGEAEEHRERIEKSLAARGVNWITPEMGFEALDTLLRQDLCTSVVTSVDWSVFGESMPVQTPLLAELFESISQPEQEEPVLAGNFITRLRELPDSGREAHAISFLQQEIQAVLRLPKAPESETGFFDLGMDSLMAVEARTRLNRAFAGEYVASNTIIFDYPNITSLARHLVEELCDVETAPLPEVLSYEVHSDSIAIVGMACRFPGAPNLESFWQLLEEGGNAVSDSRPPDRDWHGMTGDPAADRDIFRKGGFVEGIEKFDAEFFDIRPIEARSMDPCQRMVLETAWHALEEAGINPQTLKGSPTGVYIGTGNSEYREVMRIRGRTDGVIGTMQSIIPSRLSFFLGLTGPSVSVDMTCASSLVAIDQANSALIQGKINLALVGGVKANLSNPVTQFMQELGMLSEDGCCRTFDSEADGFVRGEGCGMMILKRLSDARESGDRIWGIIKGASVNQSGASAALTVPNGSAQEEVIRNALSQAGFAASEIDYLEAHGSGSQLGDPVEVRAASAVYGEERPTDRPLLLGTVKTNIGHLECASGIAGVIKVILAMHHHVIPRHLHFNNPSSFIDWDALPVRVVAKKLDWPIATDRPPRAAVSGFAITGTNAHVIVEGYADTDLKDYDEPSAGSIEEGGRFAVQLPEQSEQNCTEAWLLPLSAKSYPALKELGQRYVGWLDQRAQSAMGDERIGTKLLSDMVWTACTGRSHFACRAGIVFNSVSSLRARLNHLMNSPKDGEVTSASSTVAFTFGEQNIHAAQRTNALCVLPPISSQFTDRIDEVIQEIYNVSLSDFLSGDAKDPALSPVFHFLAHACLTELWNRVSVLPSFVIGTGIGKIGSAYAAGVISLDTGIRIAVRYGEFSASDVKETRSITQDLNTILDEAEWSVPQVTILGKSPKDTVEMGRSMDPELWIDRLLHSSTSDDNLAELLTKHSIDVVIDMNGMQESLEKDTGEASKSNSERMLESGIGGPVLIAGIKGECEKEGDTATGFLYALAAAYEAGLSVDFAELFAGRQGDRISLPLYPFQRRTFWVE